MNIGQFHRRVLGAVLALAVILGILGSALYDLQINQGEEFYRQSQFKIAETHVEEAARGLVLDRNGRVLVSNQVVYQVELDTTMMGEDQARNATLLSLIRVAREEGVSWADSLPITMSAPFAFTTEAPYYTTAVNEDGTQTLTLTRLGRLAVRMRWIQDPTLEPEPDTAAPEPEEPGLFDRLKAFFTGEEPVPEVPDQTQEEKETPLPSARQLLAKMALSFGLAPEESADPIADSGLSGTDLRAVAGVLYELYLRSKEIYWNPYVFAEDVDIDFISRVKEQALSGVLIEATTTRQYHTPYAAHLLGRVSGIYAEEWEVYKDLDLDGDGVADYEMDDTVGKDGVEKAFESYLRGIPGTKAVERNTSGKIVSETWLTEPDPGDNVVLTLDIGLQGYVENTLNTAIPNLASEDTRGAACVVLDVNSADVLAAASYPTYSLATYGADYNDLASDPLSPLLNRAFSGLYPPGSTFKMVTAIAGLEEEIIQPNTVINATGRYMYYAPSYMPQCWIYRQQGGIHGKQNVSDAIKNSCNYFFFDVGRQLGITRISDYAARFGLGEKTGLELSEKTGIMAGPAYTQSLGGTWYDGSTLSVAIGQESSQFTPIQLANYIATLVNGGTRNSTHLLKEVKSSDFSQILYTYEPEALSTIEIQDENLKAVKAGMLALTTEGSVSRYFKDLPFRVGAKTGSAQVSSQTESNAVFVCFAPYDDPQVAMAIVVERGGSGSELGAMAADILSYYFSAQESRDEVAQENTLIR